MFRNIILSTFAFLFVTSTASAAIVFNPSIFFYTREETQGTTLSEFNQQIINLKLGYMDESGLYLGGAYDIENRSFGSSTSDQDRTSVGATLGYMNSGWSLLGTYYFQSELKIQSNTYKGNGWTADFGYVYSFGSVGIGPLLSYRHFVYDKVNGSTQSPSRENNNFLPSIQFQFVF
jgi:hypothetical protein